MLTSVVALITIGTEVLHFASSKGVGKGKHIVMLAGDEEYRSEEMLPQLAKILSKRYGFECTVVFSQNDRGEIDPENQIHQPGLEAGEPAAGERSVGHGRNPRPVPSDDRHEPADVGHVGFQAFRNESEDPDHAGRDDERGLRHRAVGPPRMRMVRL